MADAGKNVSKAAQGIDRVIKDNEGDFKPTMANLRQVAQKLDEARSIRPRSRRASTVLVGRRPGSTPDLAQLDPVLKDLGSPVNRQPATDIGQAVRRINILTADLELLTSKLRDGRGGLNTDGSLQKLLTQTELHDNFNTMAITATQALVQLKTVSDAVRAFVEKVSRDPSAITRGAFQSR